MRFQDCRLTAKQIGTPQAVLHMAEEGEPGRASAIGFRQVMNAQNAANHVLVDFHPKSDCDLLSDTGASPTRIPLHFEENSSRYFRFASTWWRCRRVEGFSTTAERSSRARRMKSTHRLAIIRSAELKFGARLRPRFRSRSWCRTSTDSATTLRNPPGFATRTTVTIK
jgi:hypothetical protein